MAGYSGTPLVKKLGIKPGSRVGLMDSPAGFAESLNPLPEDVVIQTGLEGRVLFDVILWFTPNLTALKREFGRFATRLTPAGGLWVAWPKKASGVVTDLTESLVQQVGLDKGLVDNKVCAVDDVWSGLRFVIRLVDRK